MEPSLADENDPRRELEFYRRRVDELAGQAVRADSVVSRARRELKQRRQGFALLSELHGLISTDMPPNAIFGATLERLERQLKMERMVILRREDATDVFRPCFTRGFPADAAARLLAQNVVFPVVSINGSAPLLVTNATPANDFVLALKRDLETPFFVCAPISEGDTQDYFLLAGRTREAKPFSHRWMRATFIPSRVWPDSSARRCTILLCLPIRSTWRVPLPVSCRPSFWSFWPAAALWMWNWATRRSR